MKYFYDFPTIHLSHIKGKEKLEKVPTDVTSNSACTPTQYFLWLRRAPSCSLWRGWCRGSATPPSCPPPATTWWGTTPGWPRCGSTTSPGSRWVQSCRPQCDARWWLFSRCQVIRAWMIIWTLTMRKKMSGLRGTFLLHLYKKFKMFLIQNHTLRLLCCLNQAHASSK